MSIVIVDYGIGNVESIANAFASQGEQTLLSRDPEVIIKADGLILPGVGAFAHGMNNLIKYNLITIINDYVNTGKPLLGICLGMQMLLEESEEFGVTKGLGFIKGKVIKLPISTTEKIKLPHISWSGINKNKINWDKTILNKINENSDMYFVHTFVAKLDNENEILSTTKYYDIEFCSSLKKDNIYGCQFHPEKSSKHGLSIIKNYINICKNKKYE
jgi:glutamine amidotransferase